MIRNFKRTAAIIGVVAASSASLVACGDSDDNEATEVETATETAADSDSDADAAGEKGDYELSGQTGTLVAEGASSQQNAMDYFSSVYASEVPGAQLAYTPSGSGAGQKQFIADQVAFAGSDSPLKDDQVQAAADRCGGNEAWHLPFVIGPVAIAYNLDGVDELNLTVDNIVEIFQGVITTWNDPKIAEANPGVDLPDRGHGTGRHVGERLPRELVPVGEPRLVRAVLHGPPQGLVAELLELAPGPRPVPALADALVHLRGESVRLGEGLRRLPAPLERARHQVDEGSPLQPGDERPGLLLPGVVEVDAGEPPGEDALGIGRRAAVPDEDAVRHALTLGAARPRP